MSTFLTKARQHFGKDVNVVETNSEVIFIKKGKTFGQYILKGWDYPPPENRHDQIFKSIEEGFKQDIQKTHN